MFFVVLPTGYSKSLWSTGGFFWPLIIVVATPLIALMKDEVSASPQIGSWNYREGCHLFWLGRSAKGLLVAFVTGVASESDDMKAELGDSS